MARKRTGKPVGRKPKGPFKDNKAQINGRVPERLKALIKEAADRNGHSFSQEMALRLEHSFTYLNFEESEFGSPQNFAVCRLIGMMMRNYHAFDGDEFWDDAEMHAELTDAVATILVAFGPNGGIPEPKPDETRGQRRGRSRLQQLLQNRMFSDPEELDGRVLHQSADEYSLVEIWEGLGQLASKLEVKK